MADGRFTVRIVGGEEAADEAAWVAEKTFGRKPVLLRRSSEVLPAWILSVQVTDDGPDDENDWMEVAETLVKAMHTMGTVLEYPREMALRNKLDLFLRCAKTIRARHRGTEFFIELPDCRPIPLNKARGRNLTWRLL